MTNEESNEKYGRLLVHWYESLALQDVRYYSKAVIELAHHAMVDEKFRRRLVDDTQTVLRELQDKLGDLPRDVTLKFLENTKDTLNVVLPPRAEEMDDRPTPLRELLRSRTSEPIPTEGLFRDDFDFGGHGDSELQDPPITL
jgi:hypothetical protein